MVDIRVQIRDWFEDNVGTHAATDAAMNAVLRVLGLHVEIVQSLGDDSQSVCTEDGQDYDAFARPGCRTIAAIAESIRDQDAEALREAPGAQRPSSDLGG